MKIPKDVSSDRVIRLLERLGYLLIRQRSSHLRLRHDGPPSHSTSIPKHKVLKTGTLHAVLTDAGKQRPMSIEKLAGQL